MDLQSLKNQLGVLNFRRLLKPKILKHLVLGTKIFFVLLTLGIVTWGASAVTTTQDQVAAKLDDFSQKLDSTRSNQPSPARNPKGQEVQSIQLSKLFGVVGAPTPNPSAGKPSEPSLPLSLIGVFLQDDEEPYAIIQDDKKNLQDVFSPNESIFGAAKLLKIFSDKVEIDRNGTKEMLIIDTVSSSKGGSPTSQDSENEFEVEEAELDKALENLPLLLTQARAVPYFKDGKAVGLRLFAIRTGSLFEKIGLQNGDVLKSVNGNSLADLSQAMQLFQKLKEERSIDLALERNMVEKSFKYQIR